MNKEQKFNVEEFHRGKWQPLMLDVKGKETQKFVRITEDQARAMNINADNYKQRYVLGETKPNPIQVAKAKVKEIKAMKTIEEVNEALIGVTAKSILKAGEDKIKELT